MGNEPSLDESKGKDPVAAGQMPVSENAQVTPTWQDQDDRLRVLWHENKSPDDIAAELGRSVAAIMTRAARLGLPRRLAPGRKRGYKHADLSQRSKSAGMRVRRKASPVFSADAKEEAEKKESQITMRVCLMCLNKFQSLGPHNRICPACKGSAEYATGSSTPDFTFGATN